ncbi:MAG: hypothetical protein C0594_07900 [Marinilabiliales bacterium]|nr:MAG: hypothetical protein C0594_07900 [Marinilabiliales bacterium]
MHKIRLNVMGLSYSQTQAGAYALVLSEEEGNRRIPIIIGGFEAQAIAIELEGLKPPRPLTHDLIVSFATEYDISIEEVNIYKLEEGIFHSELICNNKKNRVRIDARTSDAVALALRFKCPIFTTEAIVEKAGIILDLEEDVEKQQKEEVSEKSENKSNPTGDYKSLNNEELQKALDEAIANEDYEKASKIRDEQVRRENQE